MNGHRTHDGTVCRSCITEWRRKVEGRPLRLTTLPAEPLLSMLECVPGTRTKQLDKAMWRARRTGTFSVSQADELCVTILRRHPAEVYGDEWFVA